MGGARRKSPSTLWLTCGGLRVLPYHQGAAGGGDLHRSLIHHYESFLVVNREEGQGIRIAVGQHDMLLVREKQQVGGIASAHRQDIQLGELSASAVAREDPQAVVAGVRAEKEASFLENMDLTRRTW